MTKANCLYIVQFAYICNTQCICICNIHVILYAILKGKFSLGSNCLDNISMGWGISLWRWGQTYWHYLKNVSWNFILKKTSFLNWNQGVTIKFKITEIMKRTSSQISIETLSHNCIAGIKFQALKSVASFWGCKRGYSPPSNLVKQLLYSPCPLTLRMWAAFTVPLPINMLELRSCLQCLLSLTEWASYWVRTQ